MDCRDARSEIAEVLRPCVTVRQSQCVGGCAFYAVGAFEFVGFGLREVTDNPSLGVSDAAQQKDAEEGCYKVAHQFFFTSAAMSDTAAVACLVGFFADAATAVILAASLPRSEMPCPTT